jgi:hypothetical protein
LAGLDLDPFQQLILRAALAERLDAKFAAFIVWLLVGRQNGKGSILEARQLAGLVLLGEKFAIHTAHELKTTAEHFLRMQQLIEGCPDIERKVLRIRTGKGDEAIEMKSGARQRFIARSGGSGRGFAGVDALYLDESMFLDGGMMAAVFSTMAAKSRSGNPQLWLTGSAPYGPMTETKHGQALQQQWAHAQVGMLRSDKRPSNTLYADYGITPPTDAEIDEAGGFDAALERMVANRDNWYLTNPALGERITEEFGQQELATLGPRGFAVERLGLVIPPEDENQSGIDLEQWAKRSRHGLEMTPQVVVCVDVDDAGARGSVVACQRIDGKPHLEVVEQGGVGALVDWLTKQNGLISSVVIDGGGQARMVQTLLGAAGSPLKVVTRNSSEVASDSSLFASAIRDGALTHTGDIRFRSAILAALKVDSGDRWRWSRRKSVGDPTALIAAALAYAAVTGGKTKSLAIL